MWNETTNGIHVSRDVVWLKRFFSQIKRRRNKFLPNILILKSLPSLKPERVIIVVPRGT